LNYSPKTQRGAEDSYKTRRLSVWSISLKGILMADSPELTEARKAMDVAVRNYIDIFVTERGDDAPYVTGWAGHAEYISTGLLEERKSQSTLLVPEDQSVATGIGCLTLGLTLFGIKGGAS
jgi:hypothetical protein